MFADDRISPFLFVSNPATRPAGAGTDVDEGRRPRLDTWQPEVHRGSTSTEFPPTEACCCVDGQWSWRTSEGPADNALLTVPPGPSEFQQMTFFWRRQLLGGAGFQHRSASRPCPTDVENQIIQPCANRLARRTRQPSRQNCATTPATKDATSSSDPPPSRGAALTPSTGALSHAASGGLVALERFSGRRTRQRDVATGRSAGGGASP